MVLAEIQDDQIKALAELWLENTKFVSGSDKINICGGFLALCDSKKLIARDNHDKQSILLLQSFLPVLQAARNNISFCPAVMIQADQGEKNISLMLIMLFSETIESVDAAINTHKELQSTAEEVAYYIAGALANFYNSDHKKHS